MDTESLNEIESPSRRARGRSRTDPGPRVEVAAVAPTRRKAAVKTARLSVTIPDRLLHQCQQLATHDRKRLADLVAESLQATLNRRTSFQRFLKLSEEVARSVAADAPPDGLDADAA